MTPSRRTIVGFAIVIGLGCSADSAPADGPSVVVHTVEGPSREILKAYFTADARLRGEDASGPVELPVSDVLAIEVADAASRSHRAPMVLLAGDEVFVGEILASNEEAIELKSELVESMKIPLTAVEGIVLSERLSLRAKAQLAKKIRAIPRSADAFLLANGDVLEGTVTQFGPREWEITVGGAARQVEANLLAGVALDRNLLEYKPPVEPHAFVTLTDGSAVAARRLTTRDDRLEIETFIGPVVSVPWASSPGVLRIDYRNGRVLFLSDKTPLSIDSKPFLDEPAPPRFDLNVVGSPLRIGGKTFAKGIGVRSYSKITFDVQGAQQFLATAALDDAAEDQASVVFRVYVDSRRVLETPERTAGSSPVPISIPLENARTLTLEVDFARRGDQQDIADWIDARLVRPAAAPPGS
jgi:hypothetical protein